MKRQVKASIVRWTLGQKILDPISIRLPWVCLIAKGYNSKENRALSGRLREFILTHAALLWLLVPFNLPQVANAQTPDSFYPSTSTIYAMALQGDRKFLLGGASTFMRVYQSGAIDTSFNRGCSGTVYAISEQSDGSLIVAGVFSSLGGQACTNIARLRGDGSIDNGFSANITGSIKALTVQQDGKLLVGGTFNFVNGQACTNLARLFPDGSIDAAFNPGVPGSVSCITVQNDGKIVVGGNFTSLAGSSCTNIGRLKADGTFDLAINAMGGTLYYYPYYTTGVQTMSLQSDGKILVGGLFTNLAGQLCPNIGRLNPDGTLDNGFSASVSNGVVYSLAIQTDGKIYVGGSFTGLSGLNNTNIGRIYPDGTPDSSFSSPVTGSSIYYPYSGSGYAYSLALQDDGKLLIGGSFTSINGTTRNNIGRLNYFSFLSSYLEYDNSSITWMPQSCSPAFTKTTFDESTNGTDWISLGSGVLTTNGWQLSSATILSNATIRARGFVNSGMGNGSSWFVESGAGTVAIDSQPISRTNTAGSQIGFSIQTVGQSPIYLQWYKNGQPLNDGGNIYGSSSSTLSVSNVLTADSGSYWAVASNSFGSITSMVATLTVISDPLIRTQPLSRTNSATTTATFTVGITGTTPLSYQWQKNGTNMNDGGTILGSTSSTLTLSNVFTSDIGGYSVIVTNQFGSISSSTAMLTVIDPSIISQPVGQTVLTGSNTTFSVTAIGTTPIFYQWLKDGIVINGATNSAFVITNQQPTNTGGYSVVISNSVGSVTSSIAVLTINQSQTDAFNPTASPWVYTIAIQPDNKVLIGGWLTSLAGLSCANVGRVNSDGTADPTFNPGASGSQVNSIAVQPDGKILVGGSFSTLGGQTHANLGRLNADGTLDAQFAPGASSSINCIALQPDGRILVGGSFSTLGGQSATYIGRLNQDGTLDASFTPGAGGSVNCIALQPDGKILVGGSFSKMGGQTCTNIARLNGDGTFDTNFNAGANGSVYCFSLQSDGRVLVGGSFSTLGGQPHLNIGRLNQDGTIDSSFNPTAGTSGSAVYSLANQIDGRIVLGGYFTALNGQTRSYLGRLNGDGSLDSSFDPGANSFVYAVGIQADGSILAGGWFSTLGGLSRDSIGRLSNTGTTTQTLSITDSNIIWSRTGVGPEVWRTSFEETTNGTNWIYLGDGQRITNGWNLQGVQIISNSTIRARGYVTGGEYNGSSWFFEQLTGPGYLPFVSGQPIYFTNNAGSTLNLSVQVSGYPTPNLLWLKDGLPLANGVRISGVNSPYLTVSNVFGADAGAYSVVVSNYLGGSTSIVAIASVIDPVITNQPVSQTLYAGSTATLTVGAVGTTPLSYQWLKNGNPPDGTNANGTQSPSLTLNSTLSVDSASYSVLVSNLFGCVTSSVVTLNIKDPAIVTSPSSQTVNPGQNVTFTTTVRGTLPLTIQWLKNGTAINNATNSTFVISNVAQSDIASFSVVASNIVGVATSGVAVLSFNQAIVDPSDPSYPMILIGGVSAPAINALIPQSNGKLLIGGWFATVNNQPFFNIGRLNADATPDVSFHAATDYSVSCMAAQTDGKLLIGGGFTTVNDSARKYLARLNTDGSLDTGFAPIISSSVTCMAIQANGKILIGGNFTNVTSQLERYMARLNTDGTVDNTFSANTTYSSYGYLVPQCIALQSDDRIIIGGSFRTQYGNDFNIARLNTNGVIDSGFNGTAYYSGYSGYVSSLCVQPDDKILLVGYFNILGYYQSGNYVGRLNADGSYDSTFRASANSIYDSIGLQSDGMVLVGGNYGNVIRFKTTGVQDTAFAPGSLFTVNTFTEQADGRIYGANLLTTNGYKYSFVRRIVNPTTSTQTVSYAGSSIYWLRGGSSPEIQTSIFEVSTNGNDWITLGSGQRTTNGWKFTGVSLPANYSVRVRGRAVTGQNNGSSWLVESIAGLPAITTQPTGLTNIAGSAFGLSVQAGGSSTLVYQWFKDGLPMSDNIQIIGSKTPSLVVNNAFGQNSGVYSLVVSNAYGKVTSSNAWVQIIDPIITTQPTTQTAISGQTATFNVGAFGTQPIFFQWRKNGLNIPNAQSQVLSITNAQQTDVAFYDVIITNVYGCVTSQVASLTFQIAPDSLYMTADNAISSIIPLADGKILIGGSFTNINGKYRANLARLNPDGSLDLTFSASAGYSVSCLIAQPDGNYLVGGGYATNLARVNGFGTLDATFSAGADSSVYSLALQQDGKIVIGGNFTRVNGITNKYICRVNSDGTLDTNFSAKANSWVMGLALQPDGKLLVGGNFTNLCGVACSRIGRLNADGTFDSTFSASANSYPTDIALQRDGKVLVAGGFTNLCGQIRQRIGRLNSDGTLDLTFNPGASSTVSSIALQADGKIVIGGSFRTVAGQTNIGIARLNMDGTPDNSFSLNLSTSGNVATTVIQPDGKIIIGGTFTSVGGISFSNMARLNNYPATQSSSFDGATINWMRTGSAPEVWNVYFAVSTNGNDWQNLGSGQRITGGWQLQNQSFYLNSYIKMRGFVPGHKSNWYIENVFQIDSLTPPMIRSGGSTNEFQTSPFGFYVHGLVGQTVVIQASTDLVNWMPIQTNYISSLTDFIFQDSHSANYPKRFYRLSLFQGTLPSAQISPSNIFGGYFGFNISGVAGQNILIEASTNLVNWVGLSTNLLDLTPIYFEDTNAESYSQRFFRVRMQ